MPDQTTETPQPQPVPEAWIIGVVPMADGTQQVLVQIAGPTGVKVSFLEALPALQISEQIRDASRQARTGLIVPTGPVVLPPANGHKS